MVSDLKDFIILYLLIIFIYQLGFIVLKNFFNRVLNKNNIFINLATSWFIGNSVFVIMLMTMFFLKWLNFINIKNFLFVFVVTSFFFFYFLAKTVMTKKIKTADLIFLSLILLFYIPHVLNSHTSFLIWWDAVAIWFFKAKALFYENNFLSFLKNDTFLFSSQAYPIGIPLIISIYYRLLGYVNDQLIQFYFLLFYINLVILCFGIISQFLEKKVNKLILLLVVWSFFIASNFVVYSHNGYVDLILGSIFCIVYYFVVSFFQSVDLSLKKDYLKLIFVFVGFSLMVKNEALPFSLLILLILGFYFAGKLKRDDFKYFISAIFFLFILILPFIFWQIFLKIYQVPSFLDSHYMDFLKLENLKRLKTIVNYLFLEIFNTNKYNLSLISSIMLFVYQLSYLLWNRKLELEIILLTLLFIGQFLSYVLVFVITPFPYIIQLESSLERLILHLLPMFFLLNIFLIRESLK